MDDVAIRVTNLSKSFKLPHEKHGSVKSAFVNVFRGPTTYEKQKVLKDVSFEIKKGEFFGIVGRNGSGKSTLLKLLAGIYSPNKGHIQVNGKLTPFIELGVGFNPELTGRENVFLNGALLGFSREEMNKMYKDIVEFAELEKFMDQKLKNYSSGMQVRLAFSIAIRAKSEILVLDEVLAVGDAAFQQKCISIFEKYKATKKTIVLVTHDMSIVRQYCTKALLLHDGSMTKIGDPDLIADKYRRINENISDVAARYENEKKANKYNTKISIKNDAYRINPKEEIEFLIDFSKNDSKGIKGVGVALHKLTGEYVFGANTFLDKARVGSSKKRIKYKLTPNLGSGEYFLKVAIFGKNSDEIVEYIEDGPSFMVEKHDQKWEGTSYLDHEWI